MPASYQTYKANYFIRRHMLVTNNSLVVLLEIQAKWSHRLFFCANSIWYCNFLKNLPWKWEGNLTSILQFGVFPHILGHTSMQFWTRSSKAICISRFDVLLLKIQSSSHLQLYVPNHIQAKWNETSVSKQRFKLFIRSSNTDDLVNTLKIKSWRKVGTFVCVWLH